MHGMSKASFFFLLVTFLLSISFSNAILAQPQEEEKKENFISYSNKDKELNKAPD